MDVKAIKLEPGLAEVELQGKGLQETQLSMHKRLMTECGRQEYDENRSSNALSSGQSTSSVLEQGRSPVEDNGVSSSSTIGPAPLCRQFWKAGNYDDGNSSKVTHQISRLEIDNLCGYGANLPEGDEAALVREEAATNYLEFADNKQKESRQICNIGREDAIAGHGSTDLLPNRIDLSVLDCEWWRGVVLRCMRADLVAAGLVIVAGGRNFGGCFRCSGLQESSWLSQNGATFVLVDKTLNPRDGTPALLIQDNGGGMDPEALRHCMSFGFSDKRSPSAIGQYGNGFKTSTMRLGADVIVFSRHLNDSVLTQSIGLLSYSFLTRTGLDRIVVPMVDYEFSRKTGSLEVSHRYGKEHFTSNLSLLLQWSPYSTEAELLKQFEDIGEHGTKVIIYNLWFGDDGKMELDFDSDQEDIRINGGIRKIEANPSCRILNEQHIANRLHYSLRAYTSILYLRLPDTFSIVLRGKIVEHHNIADDLKFLEYILYKPQIGGCSEPFWQVVNYADSRGRGVVGVLDAHFVQPTHNKQDFERTSLFQRLEVRLKEMTWEYWDYHCGLIGYQVKKKIRATQPSLDAPPPHGCKTKPVILSQTSPSISSVKASSLSGPCAKRKEASDLLEPGSVKRHAGTGPKIVLSGRSSETQPVSYTDEQTNQEAAKLMQERKRLRARLLDNERRNEELDLKVTKLQSELQQVQQEYDRLLAELASLEGVKVEKNVDR
ncbi:hypothetical protein Tsubulata_002943 [Turnera subulata]|uniref:Morc S5 domain-containing protein n=1 Tax=Turnera subulata TaxID=218843 RepID=A0A9Q0JFX2_9ROSI|nr:hypothetical protein Tsubulata_002943 [Turnera subulata]